MNIQTNYNNLLKVASPAAEGVNASSNAVESADNQEQKKSSPEDLSAAEKKEVQELKARDREVRQHEQAHKSAAGGLSVSGASFEYTTGPDGKRYASGGEVSIDTSGGSTPEETVQKAAQIRRAALAPASPSSQDRSVAAEASRMEMKARQEMMQSKQSSEEPDDTNQAKLGGYQQQNLPMEPTISFFA
jgi:hypothetical protein